MVEYRNFNSRLPKRSIRRPSGKEVGLNVVGAFGEPYPDGEEAFAECRDTASLSRMPLDSDVREGTCRILAENPDSSHFTEPKLGTMSWKKVHKASPWRRKLEKAEKELRAKSDELTAERRTRRTLEAEFAEIKLLVTKAEEEKDDYRIMIQRANDERYLAEANAENEKYQLMEQLKASEARRNELESMLHGMEHQPKRSKRRSSKRAGNHYWRQ
mmetsp:Transcript_28323/g.83355  ORF Transcript_28323/g.83355 Transcript_28323/m.83355 type:complete len:215 (-) Transcript_28323:258-902(-)